MAFPKEEVPDKDYLFLRVPKSLVNPDGTCDPAAFLPHGEGANAGMSTNWAKYSTAEDTRRIAKAQPPENYGVLQLLAGAVRAIKSLVVDHTPRDHNRAHTDVLNTKAPRIRIEMSRQFKAWEIKPPRKGA